MPRLFYSNENEKKFLDVSYTTDDLLRKFTLHTQLTTRIVMDKIAERAKREEKPISEDLLLQYLGDEQNPLCASIGEHDVRFDKAGFGRRARLTCHSCKDRRTLVHQSYMNKAQWNEKKAEFLKQHPCAEIKNEEGAE